MHSPLVSILLPVHNDQPFLRDCLASIQRQSYENWEILAVNDGSTDDSFGVLREISAEEARLHIFDAPHRGIVPTLNQAWTAAQGELIARMDADDRMLPQRLEKQVHMLQREPSLGLCGTQVRHFTDEEALPPYVQHHEAWSNALLTTQQIAEHLFAESPIFHPTFCGRRSVFAQLQGYEDSPWAEDYDFLLRAHLAGVSMAKVSEVLVEKRHSAACISAYEDRYKQAVNMEAKVHFAQQMKFFEQKPIWIVGSGGSARYLVQALRKAGLPIEGILDNVPHAGTERRVFDLPAIGLRDVTQPQSWEPWQDCWLAVAVGGPQGQKLTRHFKAWNWQTPQHFVQFA
jgi:glycosyltransferase involved in cell wall biosynthesis